VWTSTSANGKEIQSQGAAHRYHAFSAKVRHQLSAEEMTAAGDATAAKSR